MLAERILIHYGELALKGKNRGQFEHRLKENMRQKLEASGLRPAIYQRHGALIVAVEQLDLALSLLQDVPGIRNLARCFFTENTQDYAVILNATLALAERTLGNDQTTFAMDVRKSEKRVPWRSFELERLLGAAILQHHPHATVHLDAPAQTLFVEIRSEGVYVYSQKQQGLGGMPVGCAGKVLALLSGGIDSPVAAFLLARRGAKVDCLHLAASHTLLEHLENSPVALLAKRLSCYMGEVRLYAAPYVYFDLLVPQNSGYAVVLFRRFLARIGEQLARAHGALALVAGDSLAQVASQTLENLVSTSEAVRMPIFRPLLGFDKEDIVDKAKTIGTYELSILPYKDCCALLAHAPKTRSRPEELVALEARCFGDGGALLEKTLADMRVLRFAWGQAIQEETKPSTDL